MVRDWVLRYGISYQTRAEKNGINNGTHLDDLEEFLGAIDATDLQLMEELD